MSYLKLKGNSQYCQVFLLLAQRVKKTDTGWNGHENILKKNRKFAFKIYHHA